MELTAETPPCLIYSTFHNQILVYHNVSLPSIPSTNLLLALRPEVRDTVCCVLAALVKGNIAWQKKLKIQKKVAI